MGKSLYKLLMNNREIIMAVAIIWVMLSHIGSFQKYFLCKIGYGGVDLFFFVSGMGIYSSLKRDPDIIGFFCRRIKRIGVPYIIIVTLAFATYPFLPENSSRFSNIDFFYIADYIGNLFCFSWIQGRRTFNWFIQGIFWVYVISPILFLLVKKYKNMRCSGIIFTFIWLCLCIPCYNSDLMAATARLFLYVAGLVVAANNGWVMKKKNWIIISLMSVLGIVVLKVIWTYRFDWLNKFGLYFLPFIFIIPGIAINVAYISEKLRSPLGGGFVSLIGKHTLGIYLVHIYFYTCGISIVKYFGIISPACLIIESLVVGIIFEKVMEIIWEWKNAHKLG